MVDQAMAGIKVGYKSVHILLKRSTVLIPRSGA